MPMTNAEKQTAWRERQRALGRVLIQLWIHPSDRARLTAYVNRLNAKRGTKK